MTSSHCSILVAAAAHTHRVSPARTDTLEIVRPHAAAAVVTFWNEAGPARWFAKNPEFDRVFRERFYDDYEAAARGELSSWIATPEAALAHCILLDQYPRNAFRGTARMYATDPAARAFANAALRLGHDRALPNELALFMYLPFGHSESLTDQDRALALATRLGPDAREHALGHREIVRRFGRFPHRNEILGRVTTPEEQQFLDEGGFRG